MTGLALLLGVAVAFPTRVPAAKADRVAWEPGRQRDVLVVKLAEGLRVEGGRVVEGPGDLAVLNTLLAGARPHFDRPAEALRRDRKAVDPEGRLADLTLYLRVVAADAEARGTALLADDRVEAAFLALAAVAPPDDPAPPTPDLTSTQGYTADAPDGLGWSEQADWPDARGGLVAVADLEYGWNPDHEDLVEKVPLVADWGWDSYYYPCHGTLVLGELVAGDNGFGVTGLVTDADVVMVSPYDDDRAYNLAASVDGAASLLDPGDVLLIEQQAFANGAYAPVEVTADVWDAISLAVAKGVVVVEPGGNGGANLDDAVWDGWFDRSVRDSGAIMVGGAGPPGSGYERAWYPFGSSYGARVDLQGWYAGIATTTYDPDIDPYCSGADLFFADENQAYTSDFGGTSGASPMVAAAAVVANSVAWSVRGEPWDPMELRAALVATGTPQEGSEHIGPQVDLRAFLRTWGWR